MFGYHVLCIGSATLDNFLTIEHPLAKIKLGDKVLVKDLEKHSGGGASNAAAALSKLGLKVKILTKLGNDHDAHFIQEELKQYQVKNICRSHSKLNTDFSTILSSTKEKDRIIFVHKGASRDLKVSDFSLFNLRTDWLYLATLMGKSLPTAKFIADYALRKKIPLLFNPSLYLAQKGKKYLYPILLATTILVLNKEEAQALLGLKTGSIENLLLELRKLGPKIVVITDGSKKMFATEGINFYSLLPPQVKVVDTAGAGDAFTSGLLAGIIKKYSFADALRLGQVNASSVIQHLGTKNILLTEKEAGKMMKIYKIKVEIKKVKRNR